MRVAAFIGPSHCGKTTLICGLIRHFVTTGRAVAAIKHTHHPLNDERKGDTALFLSAGALPVILAGDQEAIIFDSHWSEHARYQTPFDLLHFMNAGIVLVEGFKNFGGWPRLDAEHIRSVQEALALLDTIA